MASFHPIRGGRYRLNSCRVCEGVKQKEWRVSSGFAERDNKTKKEYRREMKKKAIAHMGGVCQHCLTSFHPASMDFHHTNPKEKDMDPGLLMQRSEEVLYKELEKCILLCANCHRAVHYE